MTNKIAIVFNQPEPSRYDSTGEMKAVLGVLDCVKAVDESLKELGYPVVHLPLVMPVEEAVAKLKCLNADLVFNLFEGFCGFPETEAIVPETLSQMGVPYTGCQGNIIRLALDKARLKQFLQEAGVPTAMGQVLTPETLDYFRLEFPCIVKPCNEDASHGLTGDSVVYDFKALEKQVKLISESYGGRALVEKFLDGREYSATVMGKSRFTVLPVSEMVYSLPPGVSRILTFEAKWEPESSYFKGTNTICPAEISPEEQEKIAQTAMTVFKLTGCRGYARVDMRADSQGIINVLEVNPNPDISPGTGVARQSAAAGMTYTEFVGKIIELAMEKDIDDSQHPSDVKEGQIRTNADSEEYSRVQTG
jgi:D-alanine-D-alanine ligase